jgi:hypothetical protein
MRIVHTLRLDLFVGSHVQMTWCSDVYSYWMSGMHDHTVVTACSIRQPQEFLDYNNIHTVDEWHASHASPRSSICTHCVLMCPSVCMLQVARAPLPLLALMLPPTPVVWLLLAAAS